MVENRSRPQSLPWLTVLRYPAAVWVIVYHCLGTTHAELGEASLSGSLFNTFLERGFLGVSFFFVLSGFILAWNYPQITRPADYLSARAARILPVYYLSLAFAVPLMIKQVIGEGFYWAFLPKLLLVLTLTQSWIPSVPRIWNGPAWTLSCEAFFYISLIFTLPFVTRTLAGRPISRTMLAVVALWVVGLILPAVFCWRFGGDLNVSALDGNHVSKAESYAMLIIEKFPLVRVVEFLGGVAVCVGTRKWIPALRLRNSVTLVLVGVAWIATSCFLPFIFSMGTWCFPGFACVIVGAAALPAPAESRVFRFAGLLGNASYSVYLLHFSVRDYLTLLYKYTAGITALSGPVFLLALFIATTCVTTAAGILIFLRYEEPMRIHLKNYLSRFTIPFPAVQAVASIAS